MNIVYILIFFIIELDFSFVVDRQNTELGLEQRAFFNNSGMNTNDLVARTFTPGDEICVQRTVYIIVSELE